jgi:hypothetical protein
MNEKSTSISGLAEIYSNLRIKIRLPISTEPNPREKNEKKGWNKHTNQKQNPMECPHLRKSWTLLGAKASF